MRIPFTKIKKKYDIIIVGAGITGLTVLDRFLERKIDRRILEVEIGSMLSKDPYPSNLLVKLKSLQIKETSRFFGVGGGCLNFSESVNPSLTYIALSFHLADQICKDYYEKNH